MAENETSQEKTEQPTSKRLQDAKEKGQVARSKDFTSFLVLSFASIAFITLGPMVSSSFLQVFRMIFQFDISVLTSPDNTLHFAKIVILNIIISILPVFFIVLLAGILGPILIGGWVFSAKSVAPKFDRLNPLKGIKRMFSIKSLMELVKAFLKFLVVAVVAILVWRFQLNEFLTLGDLAFDVAIIKSLSMVAWSFLLVTLSLIFIIIIDVPFQLYQHQEQLKMTMQEVKDEYKETEGKPEVKSKIRRLQQEVAQRRMMQEVPKADVILTNPTHYAVALSYNEQGTGAPKLLAKGKDFMALQISKIGKAHQVPLMRLPPLTRAIYFSTELNQEIPRGLYIAVAQVLAYIFQLKRRDRLNDLELSPEVLTDLPIPDELQRNGEENV